MGIQNVSGTGPRGRIIKQDILNCLSEKQKSHSISVGNTDEVDIIQEMSTQQKVIAQRLSLSKKQSPHFYIKSIFNTSALLKLRTQINENIDIKISINDFFIKAIGNSMI